jgi:hypothetical protein
MTLIHGRFRALDAPKVIWSWDTDRYYIEEIGYIATRSITTITVWGKTYEARLGDAIISLNQIQWNTVL